MKKTYEKPTVEVIELEVSDSIMDVDLDNPSFGDGVEDWE